MFGYRFQVSSWAYGTEKIKLHAHVEHSLDHYAPNEEWHLKNVSVDEDEYEHEGIKVGASTYRILPLLIVGERNSIRCRCATQTAVLHGDTHLSELCYVFDIDCRIVSTIFDYRRT